MDYRGIEYESQSELFALYWLFELLDEGYITKIDRSESFILSEALVKEITEVKELKTKTKYITKEKTILHGHIYTPEFKLTLDDEFVPFLYPKTPLHISDWITNTCYVEVKNDGYDFNNMTRLNQLNRKWLYQKEGIIASLIKPIALMKDTFTPKEYFKTPTGKDRKINFKTRTLEEWLESIV
jgi:hypothetical protein